MCGVTLVSMNIQVSCVSFYVQDSNGCLKERQLTGNRGLRSSARRRGVSKGRSPEHLGKGAGAGQVMKAGGRLRVETGASTGS